MPLFLNCQTLDFAFSHVFNTSESYVNKNLQKVSDVSYGCTHTPEANDSIHKFNRKYNVFGVSIPAVSPCCVWESHHSMDRH